MRSFVITLLVASSAASEARACSCAQPQTPQEALDAATAVFRGRVVNVGTPSGAGCGGSSIANNRVTFEVDTVWKGDVIEDQALETAQDGAACGRHFDEDQTYLVYAHGSDGELSTGLCSRTTEIGNADADLMALGDGTPPAGGGCAAAGAAAWPMALALGLLWRARRRRG